MTGECLILQLGFPEVVVDAQLEVLRASASMDVVRHKDHDSCRPYLEAVDSKNTGWPAAMRPRRAVAP